MTHLLNKLRNTLQSLSNCAYLVATDSGVSAGNHALLAQMQSDIATMSLLLERLVRRAANGSSMEGISLRRS
jgi:hypothetical protein